ncbi:MAG: V-type H+-transporting ATPase subunit D [Methanosaeta sp. NSM2]|nr:MAG: V-type H+-transporting ATPase subunit D [Methanosaeta sp. NSP1]OYV14365.1 MAG: V-type H+-transporting ATPase subunit D [Methanosaeta sp. NSM2]
MKRDGLMIEFFEVLNKAKTVRKELVEALLKAEQRLQMATATEGSVAIGSVAYSLQKEPTIVLESRNIMGVVVPKITADAVQKKMFERGYGIIGTSAAIDEAADAYEVLLDKIILAAEVETGMIRLLEDIDSTKRRVNALEFKVVPDLKLTIKFISMALEEMDRDNLVKMKMLKGKSERKAAAEEAKKLAETEAAAKATA